MKQNINQNVSQAYEFWHQIHIHSI